MANAPRVSLQAFSSAGPGERGTGLLGWIVLEVDGLFRLEGIALRQTRAGHLTLSFPERRDRTGRDHPYIRPLGDEARREIEAQVFAALGIGEVTP